MDFSKDDDSFEAFSEAIKSLSNFNQIISARHQAGYRHHNKKLHSWVILGRFFFDTCGNFMIFSDRDSIPAVRFPDIPPVLTDDQFYEYVEKNKKPNEYLSTTCTFSWFPKADQICPVCRKGWTMANCGDFVVDHDDKLVDARDFVGQTVAGFKAKWNKDNHRIHWFLRCEYNLKNKKYIDRHIRIDDIYKAEDQHQVNEYGWVETDDDHVIEPGDYLYVHIVTFRHTGCFRHRQAKLQHDYFERIFRSAGFKNIAMTEIPNQYHGENCLVCAPWYRVTTNGLDFTIGWRKRVISIEINKPPVRLDALFRHEDVTKEANLIHAWGRKKCVEYLTKIRQTASSPIRFVYQIAFWPNIISSFFKNEIGWIKLLFHNPKLYRKLRFQKKK